MTTDTKVKGSRARLGIVLNIIQQIASRDIKASAPPLPQLGREEPAMSMDASGKVMWARHSEVQQANLKSMGGAEVRDGERLPLGVKDMGSCEIFPQTIQHSPNGR